MLSLSLRFVAYRLRDMQGKDVKRRITDLEPCAVARRERGRNFTGAELVSGMARRQTEFTLADPLQEAFRHLRRVVEKQRWIVVGAESPHIGDQAELSFKAGPAQVAGCGKTRVSLRELNPSETAIAVETTRALSNKRAETPALSLAKGLRLEPESLGLDPNTAPTPGKIERNLVRFLVALVLCGAILAFILMPLPKDEKGNVELPAVALDQAKLYRLEVSLLVFYGGLLLLTPVFSGLIRGRLPTEISARGAKFAEEIDQSVGATQQAVEELEKSTNDLADELAIANLDIEQLKKGAGG